MKRVVLQYEYTVSLFNMVIKEYKYIFPYDGVLTAQIMRGLANIRTISYNDFFVCYNLHSKVWIFMEKSIVKYTHVYAHESSKIWEKNLYYVLKKT